MDSTSALRRARRISSTLLLALYAQLGTAATLAHFSFEDANNQFLNTPSAVSPHLTVSAFEDLDKTAGAAAGNPGQALSARSFHDGNTFGLRLTPEAGYGVTVTGITFDLRASSTGPSQWALSVGDVAVANGVTAASFTTHVTSFASAVFTQEFSLALTGTGASSSLGTLRLDNVQILGNIGPVSAVPLPAPIALMACALASLGARRRMR